MIRLLQVCNYLMSRNKTAPKAKKTTFSPLCILLLPGGGAAEEPSFSTPRETEAGFGLLPSPGAWRCSMEMDGSGRKATKPRSFGWLKLERKSDNKSTMKNSCSDDAHSKGKKKLMLLCLFPVSNQEVL